MPVPATPKIYHITHVGNLPSIIADRGLLSDAQLHERKTDPTVAGMRKLKQGRLLLPVKCYAPLRVGECVPFYFCPRSVMLYMLHRGNSPELAYKGGQEPIVHLVADLHAAVQWAQGIPLRWAFSLTNAAGRLAEFRRSLAELDDIDWSAVAATNWSAAHVKERKQAEFLVELGFPWSLVEHIGVYGKGTMQAVHSAMAQATHRPKVSVERAWYY